jgi:chromosome partitioning protein
VPDRFFDGVIDRTRLGLPRNGTLPAQGPTLSMPVIAVINRKGGSGKSTLATHLAAYCAATGNRVMLGDVDRQQSAQAWLRLRGAQKLPANAAIQGWTLDPKNVLRAPAGVTHVILDTPGGMRGFELARIVMSADAILMPVCNSVFDRESAAECYAELKTLPRVATGRCKIAAIGMRLDARTRADDVLADWAKSIDLPFVGVLREAQAYVRCIELGLTLFDMPKSQVLTDLAQWKPILAWLEDAARAPEAAPAPKNGSTQAQATTQARADAAEAATKPVPARVLAVPREVEAPRPTDPSPRPVAHVERAPQDELAHAGTLASIGELARTLKAAERHEPEAASPRSRPAQGDAQVVPLRPTRPVVAPSGRPAAAGARHAQPAAQSTAQAADATRSPTAVRSTAPAQPAARPSATAAKPASPAPVLARTEPACAGIGTRLGQLLDTLPIPRFLQRNS